MQSNPESDEIAMDQDNRQDLPRGGGCGDAGQEAGGPEENLRQLEWMLASGSEAPRPEEQAYGDLSALNTQRLILDSVGKDLLYEISRDYLDLLGTSSAIYEKNGDYAFGIFASGWCRFLDAASRRQCGAEDNRQAMACGRWHCHESCWGQAARPSIGTRQPVDVECAGGIHLYAVPILAGGEVVGSMSFGYGNPPRDPAVLKELAAKYDVDVAELEKLAREYPPRPPFIIEMAKKRLLSSARFIGALVERKQAQEAIQKNEQRFRGIFENAGVGIVEADSQDRFIAANERACQILGYQIHELLGMTVHDLAAPEDQACSDELNAQLHEGRFPRFDAEKRYVRSDGTPFWLHVTVAAVRDMEGRYIGGIATLEDISDRKRAEDEIKQTAEDLRRSNWDLEQFAYVASHDLQEPLRMVSSYMDLLESRYKDKLDKDAREFIGFAADGSRRMQQLIKHLLTYSRVGTRASAFQQAQVQASYDRAVADLGSLIRKTAAEITHDPLPAVWADQTQLTQVLQNLLGNAIKFRSALPPRIHVGVQSDQAQWIFSVRDNGIGIEPRNSERIFQVFQRLHTRQEYPGSGIGLAICKKIVERHGGRIWVESQPQSGSTFYFTIPKPKKDLP